MNPEVQCCANGSAGWVGRFLVGVSMLLFLMRAFGQDNQITLVANHTVREGDAPSLDAVVLRLAAARTNDTVVQMAGVPAGEVELDEIVTIPAGQLEIPVRVVPIDDALLDGAQVVVIGGTNESLPVAPANLIVLDNESTNINLILPVALAESAGVVTNAGRITLGGLCVTNVSVTLMATPPGRIILPDQVTVLAGHPSVAFDIEVLENSLAEGSITNYVTAAAAGLNPGQTALKIFDDDPFAFQLPDIASPQYVGIPFTNKLQVLDPNGQQLTCGQVSVQLRIESPEGTNELGSRSIANGQATVIVTPDTPLGAATLVVEGQGVRGVSVPFNILKPLARKIPGPVRDAAWSGSVLYAVVPDGAPAYAGQIVTVDLSTGNLTPWAVVPGGINSTGAFAGRLVADPDGARLFLAAGQGETIQMWEVSTATLAKSYTLPAGQKCADLAVSRGSPFRLALAVAGTGTSQTGVVLDAALQPQSAPISHWLHSVIANPMVPETFYYFRPYSIDEWKTGSAGVIGERTLRSGPYTDAFLPMATTEGRIFSADGYVGELATAKAVGTFPVPKSLIIAPAMGRMAVDAARREVILASPASIGQTRVQSFGVTDFQLHREILAPLSFSSPRRVFCCGSNLLAVVATNTLGLVQWPLASGSGNLPDLAILPSALPATPILGSNWDWTVTVTNSGAARATDVRLRVVLTTNEMMIQGTAPTGKIWAESNIIQAWMPELAPGSNLVLSFTLASSVGGWTTNLLSAFANEDESDLTNNQATVVSYMAPAGMPESVETLRLSVCELVADPLRQKLYALERTTATNQIALYELDGATLAPHLLRMLPGPASCLRLSTDARFLYAAAQGGRGLLRVDLSGSEPDLQFETFNPDSLGQYHFFDMAVDPYDSRTVVVVGQTSLPANSYETTVASFRDGVKLSKALSFLEYSSTPAICLKIDPANRMGILARDTTTHDVDCLNLVADGLEAVRHFKQDGVAAGFTIGGSLLYTGYGNEISPVAGQLTRSLPTWPSGYGLMGRTLAGDRLYFVQSGGLGRVQVFDRVSLGRLGVINFSSPGIIDSLAWLPDGRLALASQNGSVLVLKNSLLADSAMADLALYWSFQPAQPRVGDLVQVTIVITNSGPTNAIAPAVTFESPRSFIRQSVTPAAAPASGNYYPYPLLWTNTPLAPGQSRMFQVAGTFTGAGNQVLSAGVADRTVDSLPPNRISQLFSVPYQLGRGQEAQLELKVLDAVRDPVRPGILALAAPDDPLAGRLVAVDLATGLPTADWDIGAAPSQLALGDDDRTLYVVIDGGTNVVQLDLQTMAVQRVISAGSGTNTGLKFNQLVVNSGKPSQFAAVRSDYTLALYDATNAVIPLSYEGGDLAAFAPDRFITYRTQSPFELRRYRVQDSALVADGGGGAFETLQIEGFRTALGLVFATDGRLVDPFQLVKIGNFAAGGVSATYATADLVFFPGEYGTVGLQAFDLHTQTLVGSETFGATGASTCADLFTAGADYVIGRYTSSNLYVMRPAVIPIQPPADLSVAITGAGPWQAGRMCDWKVTVTNCGANVASNAQLDLRLPHGMKLAFASQPVISAVTTQASLALGPLAAGESRQIALQAVAEKASLTGELVVSVRSDAVDPQLTNNVARLAQPIAFASLPNRVDYLPLASADLVYEPVGRMLYLACTQFSDTVSNAIVALDPYQGTIQQVVSLPGPPGVLAVSDGGEYLYVTLNAADRILRLTLPNLETNLMFTTDRDNSPLPRPDADLVVLPGHPESVAFSRFGGGGPEAAGVWIYDNGQPRSNSVPGGYDGVTYIVPGLASNTLIAWAGAQFRTLTWDAGGVYARAAAGGVMTTSFTGFGVGGDNLLSGSEVFSRTTFSKRGLLTASFAPAVSAISASGSRVVFAAAQNYAVNPLLCAGFRTDTLAETGEVRLDGPLPHELQKLVLWGDDGVALIGSGYVFLGRLDLAGPPSDDIDGDGMPDVWETRHGLLVGANDALGDRDADGAANFLEYLSGTDPNSAADIPRLSVSRFSRDTLQLVFPCGGGRHYYVETTFSVSAGTWTEVCDAVSLGGMEVCNVNVTDGSQQYFRVRISP